MSDEKGRALKAGEPCPRCGIRHADPLDMLADNPDSDLSASAEAVEREDGAKRHVVWLCAGCDECDPQDGTPRSQGPCDGPSMNGAEVVLAEDHDRLLTAERHRTAEVEAKRNEAQRALAQKAMAVERLRDALRQMIRVTELPGTRSEIAPEMERAKSAARAALGEQA